MAAEEAWKTRYRELMGETERRCRRLIAWKIVYARSYLAAPIHAAAADEARTILRLPAQALEDAAGELAVATPLLERAKEVARRGGAGDAPGPLPSILLGHPHMTAVQREAWRSARDARMLAVEAYHAMELCCDSLLSVRHLLHYPAPLLPGVDGVIEDQLVDAYELLASAKEKVDACAALAARARDDVSGAAG